MFFKIDQDWSTRNIVYSSVFAGKIPESIHSLFSAGNILFIIFKIYREMVAYYLALPNSANISPMGALRRAINKLWKISSNQIFMGFQLDVVHLATKAWEEKLPKDLHLMMCWLCRTTVYEVPYRSSLWLIYRSVNNL